MRHSIRATLVAATALAAVTALAANEHEVSQHDRKFSVSKLTVHKGDTVQFRNMDPFFHNVFSVTPGSEFDLGAYPQGEAKPVTFKKLGTVEVECALHPEMKMVIEVTD